MSRADTHVSGRSKVDVYQWGTQDDRGELRYLEKSVLRVDHAYQRDHVTQSRVNQIAGNWSHMACGVLSVADRGDGLFWVFDGQHRKLAADKRVDIKTLPCIIFRTPAVRDEANAFLKSNTTRGPVRKVEAFKAMVLAGDEHALAVKRLVEDSGYRIAPGGGGRYVVSCVGSLMSKHAQDAPLLTEVWGICLELFDGSTITGDFVDTLFMLEQHCRNNNDTVMSGHNRTKLLAEGRDAISKKMAESAALFGKGGAKPKAQGVILLLNRGRRSRHIPNIM